MNNTIKIGGELESVATNHKVADVLYIKDRNKNNKSQAEINTEFESAINNRYTKEESYNKEEIAHLISPQNSNYKVYNTYEDLVSETTHINGTIYRVSKYDGIQNQVNITKYSEYAWDGTQYILLSVKTQIDEVFDISKYNNETTYLNLTAALGVKGANIPEGIRKGGMSIKFIQTDNNKYVQYTLKSNVFTVNPFEWESISKTINNVSEISKEETILEEESIQITNNAGTEVIHEINEDNANFKNLRNNGKSVLTTDNLKDITKDINEIKTNLVPADVWDKLPIMLTQANTYSSYNNPKSIIIPCKSNDEYYIKGSGNNCIIAFIKTYPEIGETADYATGSQRTLITGTNKLEGVVPEDAKYLYVSYSLDDATWFAEKIVINDYDYVVGLSTVTKDIKNIRSNINTINGTISEVQADNKSFSNKIENITRDKVFDESELIELRTDDDKEITEIEGIRKLDVIDGLLFVEDEYDENNPDESKVVLDVTKEKTKAKSFVAETFKTLDGVNIVKKNYFEQSKFIPDCTSPNVGGPLFYEGDTKADSNYIVNAVTYPNGEIIACRRGGSVVKIANDGTETEVINIPNAGDWRGVFIDKDLNVYVSPHDSFGQSSTRLSITDRGLYRLGYEESEFIKVISLYNTESTITSETQRNDDTIWTMCQDNKGYLYAGVYAHTVRANPAIYRSTDGGRTWTYIYNFKTSGICPSGLHIHVIIYNEFDDKLYCIVGEVNEIYCSSDQGVTWKPLGVKLEDGKGSAMIAVKDGLIVGSDTAYSCLMSKVYTDLSHKTTGRTWANTVFAIRRSDLTGWLYAFTKIDSSVNVLDYMPPIGAIRDDTMLQNWKDGSYGEMGGVPPRHLAEWEKMYNNVKDYYPNDCIRPQHCAILCSKDDGETWQIVYKEERSSKTASGFPTTGYFRNGECLTGITYTDITNNSVQFKNPIIISEGPHKYTSSGIDVQNEIFAKTLHNTVINN